MAINDLVSDHSEQEMHQTDFYFTDFTTSYV